MPVTSYSEENTLLRIIFLFCSVTIASAGRLREIAGLPLVIFYNGRLHGATDFFTFILARLAFL